MPTDCEQCRKYEELINAWMERFQEYVLRANRITPENTEVYNLLDEVMIDLTAFLGWD